MTLTFQGHDLCKITFWAMSWLLFTKTFPKFNTRQLGQGHLSELKTILNGLHMRCMPMHYIGNDLQNYIFYHNF